MKKWGVLLSAAAFACAAPEPETAELELLIRPYVTLGADYRVSVDAARARRDGVPERAIQFATSLAELNNRYADAPLESRGAWSGAAELEAFFEEVAEGRVTVARPLDERFGEAEQPLACGGDYGSPHGCPPRVASGATFMTNAGAVARVVGLGYHRTAFYARASYGADDFTRCAAAYGCWSRCAFRSQAGVYAQGSGWTYNEQSPEPNPEIFSYLWPAWWWGTYVRWWHLNYC